MPITYDIDKFSRKTFNFFLKLNNIFHSVEFQQRFSQDIVHEFIELVKEFKRNFTEYQNSHQENINEEEDKKNKEILNCSPLVYLAKLNIYYEQFLEILKEQNINFGQVDYQYKNTALTWALANASNEFAYQFLIFSMNNNLDININHRSGFPENTALHLAIAKAYSNCDSDNRPLTFPNIHLVGQLIICGADPNICNKSGFSALDVAVARRDLEMICTIIDSCNIDTLKKAKETLNKNFQDSKAIVADVLYDSLESSAPMEESLFNDETKKQIGDIIEKRLPKINFLQNPNAYNLSTDHTQARF